jgi:hypothetical protein
VSRVSKFGLNFASTRRGPVMWLNWSLSEFNEQHELNPKTWTCNGPRNRNFFCERRMQGRHDVMWSVKWLSAFLCIVNIRCSMIVGNCRFLVIDTSVAVTAFFALRLDTVSEIGLLCHCLFCSLISSRHAQFPKQSHRLTCRTAFGTTRHRPTLSRAMRLTARPPPTFTSHSSRRTRRKSMLRLN